MAIDHHDSPLFCEGLLYEVGNPPISCTTNVIY